MTTPRPRLALLNAAITTADGTYELRTITRGQARAVLADHGGRIESAIGHFGTAEALSAILGVKVPVNRRHYVQEPGTTALILQVHGRLQEGRNLTYPELEQIGFDLKTLTRLT